MPTAPINKMKKIIVIGCPGCGKSTLARALSERTGLPLYYLDNMYWNADKTTVDRSTFVSRLEAVLAEDEWIIDGNYSSTMEMRMAACEGVIFLDYPTEICLRGVRERRGKPRPDMPWIETEEDGELTAFIKRYGIEERPRVLSLIDKYKDGRSTLIFGSREEADEFLLSPPTKTD